MSALDELRQLIGSIEPVPWTQYRAQVELQPSPYVPPGDVYTIDREWDRGLCFWPLVGKRYAVLVHPDTLKQAREIAVEGAVSPFAALSDNEFAAMCVYLAKVEHEKRRSRDGQGHSR